MILSWNLESQGQALTKIATLIDEGKIKSITTKHLDLTLEGLKEAHTCEQITSPRRFLLLLSLPLK